MKFLRHCFLLACLACQFVAPAQAQQRSTFGFSLGYEFGVPLDIDRDPGGLNPFLNELNGTSLGHTGWLGARYYVPNIFSGIHLRLGVDYGLAQGNFTSEKYRDSNQVFYREIGFETDPEVDKQMVVTNMSHLFSPSIAFTWQPGDNWQLGVGFWTSFVVGSNIKREEEIIDADQDRIFWSTNTRTRVTGEDMGFPFLRFGPSISTSWRWSAGKNLDISPEIFGKMDITSAELGIGAMSAGIRFNFIFDPEYRPVGDIIDEDAPQEDELPKLTAEVRITSNGVSLDDAITAEPRSVLHRRFETLLPFLEIPTVTDRSRVERMIDLLGKRLVEVPAGLTLVPTASDPTLPEAARELANNITTGAERMKQTSGAQHAAPMTVNVAQPAKQRGITASGLVITSDQPSMLRPLADQWIDSRYQLPPITIERYTDSRAGLKSWNVTVRQGRRTLAKYSNLEGSTAELESGLVLTTDQSSTIEPVLAEMTITDLAGQVRTVYDTLRVRKGNADPDRADSVVYEFILYSAGGNHTLSDELTASNKLLIKTLKDQVPSAESIEIHYSPRSQKFASEIFGEISPLLNDAESSPEIKLRTSRELSAPAGINVIRVLLAQ